MEIKDKVAIVTGASGGIGEATTRLLSQRGARVALVARREPILKKLEKEFVGSKAFVCDMSKPNEVRSAFSKIIKHFGRVDILVNNAGLGYDSQVENINVETFRKIFDLNVVGYLVAMQEVIPQMRKAGGGAIVNVSSGTALMTLPNMAGYSSLKRTIVGLSLTAREELKDDNITVGVVYPFITDTDFEKNTIKEGKMKWPSGESRREIPPADSAVYIAEKIVDSVKSGEAEVYAHDWMKPGNRRP